MNLLLISPDFNYSCGVSKHVYLLLKELKKNNNYNLFFITNKGDSLDRLTKLGIQPTILGFNRGNRNVYKLIKNVLSLYIFCKKNKINVIHTHHRYPELVAYLVSKLLHIKTITTVHSLLSNLKYVSFRSEKIIAVSNFVKDNLISNYKISSDRIVVIYNFIEPFIDIKKDQKEKFLMNHNFSGSDRILLFAGRINEIKGCDILIQAFNELTKSRKHIKLLVIGVFELSSQYEEIVKNSKSIFCIKPTEEMTVFYHSIDIIVLPSRIDPFPYVMLEAGLAIKPLIGGRTGGIAEFIEDGVDGLLVEPGNSEDLIKKINYILDNPNHASKMAENLNKKVKKMTNPEEYIKIINDLYLSKP